MVLSDRITKEEIAKGRIVIDPLNLVCIQLWLSYQSSVLSNGDWPNLFPTLDFSCGKIIWFY